MDIKSSVKKKFLVFKKNSSFLYLIYFYQTLRPRIYIHFLRIFKPTYSLQLFSVLEFYFPAPGSCASASLDLTGPRTHFLACRQPLLGSYILPARMPVACACSSPSIELEISYISLTWLFLRSPITTVSPRLPIQTTAVPLVGISRKAPPVFLRIIHRNLLFYLKIVIFPCIRIRNTSFM